MLVHPQSSLHCLPYCSWSQSSAIKINEAMTSSVVLCCKDPGVLLPACEDVGQAAACPYSLLSFFLPWAALLAPHYITSHHVTPHEAPLSPKNRPPALLASHHITHQLLPGTGPAAPESTQHSQALLKSMVLFECWRSCQALHCAGTTNWVSKEDALTGAGGVAEGARLPAVLGETNWA